MPTSCLELSKSVNWTPVVIFSSQSLSATMSNPSSNLELLHPLSTQVDTSHSVDSAVAMSTSTEEFKESESAGNGDQSHTEPDRVHEDGGDKLENSRMQVIVHEKENMSEDAKASALRKNEIETAESVEGTLIPEYSLLVKAIQRIVQGSSANITLKIEDTSEENSKEKTSEDDEEDEENEEPGSGKPYRLRSVQWMSDNLEAEGCQCVACINEAKHPHEQISHAVDFLDDEMRLAATRPRKKPFNLDKETKRVSPQGSSTAFTVTTVLSTSIAAHVNQYLPHIVQGLVKDNLMRNKDIGVKFHTMKLSIASPAIMQALRNVVLYYPDLGLRSDRLSLESPFSAIAQHLDKLQEYRLELMNSDSVGNGTVSVEFQKQNFPPDHQSASTLCYQKSAEHLGSLLDYLKTSYGDRIRAEKALNKQGLCNFSMLWLMLQPGTTVYVRTRRESLPSAMVIKSVETDPGILFRNDSERSPYKLHLWYLDFDGRKVGRCLHEMELAQFDGEKKLTSLEVIPAHFLDLSDQGETRAKITERGRKWFRLLKGKMVRYQGQFMEDTLSRPVGITHDK